MGIKGNWETLTLLLQTKHASGVRGQTASLPTEPEEEVPVIYIFYVHVIPTAQIITGAMLIAYCGKHRLDKMLVKLKLTVNIPVSYTTYNFLPRLEGVVGLTYLLRNALLYSAPMWLLA